MEKPCVLCVVWNKVLCICKWIPDLRGLAWLVWLLRGVSPRTSRFDPKLVSVRSVVVKVALGQMFLSARGFPCQFHSINASYSFSSTCCSYYDRRAVPGNIQKNQCSLGIRRVLDRKTFSLGLWRWIYSLTNLLCSTAVSTLYIKRSLSPKLRSFCYKAFEAHKNCGPT